MCQSNACIDYFAGSRWRNTTLPPGAYAGQYVAPRMSVVLVSPTWTQNPYVLAHEFSHVEVATRISVQQHVPAWFDEGLATYLAGEPICTNVSGKGIDDLHFHDLRHSSASAMINEGIDLYTVGAVLGHKDAASTKRYSHLATATLATAIGTIGKKSPPPSKKRAA